MKKIDLIFCIHGRLGNQFFILSGFLYTLYKYNDYCNCYIYIHEYVKNDYPDLIEYIYNNFSDYIVDNIDSYDYEHIFDIDNDITHDQTSDLDKIIKYYINSQQSVIFNAVMLQTSKYFLEYKDNIKEFFIKDISKGIINDYNINDNSLFISVRRGDYIPFYYVLTNQFYIDMYNTYFKGLDIYITSDDIDWCKENFCLDSFNNCKSITFIENKSALEIVYLAQYFKNFICANYTFSAMCLLFSNYNITDIKSIGVINQKYNDIRYTIYLNNTKTIDLRDNNYRNYVDNISDVTFVNIDKIYCIHMVNCNERLEHCINEFSRVGLNVDIINCCTHKIDYKIGNYLKTLHTEYYKYVHDELHKDNIYQILYNVVTNHYNTIKISYELGYNYIMIFEDDVTFYGDEDHFKNIIKNLPLDFDILKLKSGCGDMIEHNERLKTDNKFINVFSKTTHNDEDLGVSSEGYILSRTGMKLIIDELDKQICPFDLVFNRIIKKYSHKYNIYINNYNVLVNTELPSLTV